VKHSPLRDQAQGAWAEVTVENLAVVDADGRMVATVLSMEMWRRMFVVVHRDNDPKETAYFRQVYLLRPDTTTLSLEAA